MQNVIDDLVARISRITLLLNRRLRLWADRLGSSADGLIILPLLGIALVLAGVLAATAATRQSSDGGDSDFASARLGSDLTANVVTEIKNHVVTIEAPGKVVTVERGRVRRRILGHTAGVNTIFEPAKTVSGPTKTVTVAGPRNTVTQVVTETVTTVVTVTEKTKP